MYVSNGERIRSDMRIGRCGHWTVRVNLDYPTTPFLNTRCEYVMNNEFSVRDLVQSLRLAVYEIELPEMTRKGMNNAVK